VCFGNYFFVSLAYERLYKIQMWVGKNNLCAGGMLSATIEYNGLRVGDVALCCACGKAILLTRC